MLKLVNLSDFDFIYGLYMHEAINPYLLYEIMNKEDFKPIYNELIEQNQLFVFIDKEEKVGMCKLIFHKHRDSHKVYLGGLGINPLFFGKGFGKKIMFEIIDLCIQKNMKRIELSVAIFNENAIKLYESVGFEKEGILKNYTYLKSENRYIDEYMMAKILN